MNRMYYTVNRMKYTKVIPRAHLSPPQEQRAHPSPQASPKSPPGPPRPPTSSQPLACPPSAPKGGGQPEITPTHARPPILDHHTRPLITRPSPPTRSAAQRAAEAHPEGMPGPGRPATRPNSSFHLSVPIWSPPYPCTRGAVGSDAWTSDTTTPLLVQRHPLDLLQMMVERWLSMSVKKWMIVSK